MAGRLKGWKFGVFVGGFVGAVVTTMYFSAIRAMIDPEPYKQVRNKIEKDLPQLGV